MRYAASVLHAFFFLMTNARSIPAGMHKTVKAFLGDSSIKLRLPARMLLDT